MKKTPVEWLAEPQFSGVVVMDPDGWRGEDAPAWEAPISFMEFCFRLSLSTVIRPRPGANPQTNGPRT